MNTNQLPEVTRTYQNHVLDSTRWQYYTPRAGDVIVSTSYKSGTTWIQYIVLQLTYGGQAIPTISSTSPWVDFRLMPLEVLKQMLAAPQKRRCLKTHLALDGLPYYPQVNYIVVGRDAHDVFMSWWNHYSNFTDDAYERLNNTPGRVGDPMPRCPQDIREYWRTWITRGWFAWEREGYPHSGNMHHTQTWWQFRHLPNILFVHYSDLLANLEEEIARVAKFLDIAVSSAAIAAIAKAVSLQEVKKDPAKLLDPVEASMIWKEGVNTFFHKGTNGRWRDVLTNDDLALYEQTASTVLTPDCRLWLEKGRIALI